MGVPSCTKRKGVLHNTPDDLGGLEKVDVGEADPHDDSPVDDYILDLDQGISDGDDLFLNNDTPSSSSKDVIIDPLGEEMFNPHNIKHPKSAVWYPLEHVAKCITKLIRHPLEKGARNLLRAECSRPVIQDKVCPTSNLDSELITFLSKLGIDPRKGLKRSLKSCQDRLLDVVGPLARIIDMVEEVHTNDLPLDVNLLRG
ncbi:hypothetical protein NDU88_010686 [Pleurodeles waltl]|uniref:Uncharacterized protein n=1 Tax=Pleurodeles waltl TaxID=8319 RepID=A0AAV7S2L8_PLEWA|nr:hypothetical protein NDU88_010686 [Pleurodeles waltl]